jgi:hypothetical protein
MTSLYGIDPIFDYTFTYPENVWGRPVEKKGYLQDSIMDILEKKFPNFAFIVKTARLDEMLSYNNSFRSHMSCCNWRRNTSFIRYVLYLFIL